MARAAVPFSIGLCVTSCLGIFFDQLYCLVPLFSVRGKVESACTGSSSPSVFPFFSAAFPLGGASIRILLAFLSALAFTGPGKILLLFNVNR